MMIFDGFTGYSDQELDEMKKQWKAAGFKVNDRRKWRNRIFRKSPKRGLTGIWYNIKTKHYEEKNPEDVGR